MQNIYQQGLDKNTANYTPLTPLTFIARTAYIYPDRTAVIHGQRRYTWGETFRRARRMPRCLFWDGLGKGDDTRIPKQPLRMARKRRHVSMAYWENR